MNETNKFELLLVEDNPQDLEFSLRALRKASLLNRIHIARDGAEALGFIFCEGPHAADLPVEPRHSGQLSTAWKGQGEVAEWSNAPDSKSGVPQGTGGSNPSLSANFSF